MKWPEFHQKVKLTGRYADVLKEQMPSVPFHPELAEACYYRGRITHVDWEADQPLLHLSNVLVFNHQTHTWQTFSSALTLDFHSVKGVPTALNPIVWEDMTVEIASLTGCSAVVYPENHPLPPDPHKVTVSLPDLISLFG